MKTDIHPKYNQVTIQCACGSTFATRSTLEGTVQVDICSSCHPFFTGKQRVMDTAGRIDRFRKKFGNRVVHAAAKTVKHESSKTGAGSKLSLKDKLQAAKEKAASQIKE